MWKKLFSWLVKNRDTVVAVTKAVIDAKKKERLMDMHKKLLKGKSQDIIDANIRTLKDNGYSQARATRTALCCANKKHDHDAERIGKKVAKSDPNAVKVIGGR